MNKIYCADYLEFLKHIPDNTVDAVITDPPYNITQNKWDTSIDLESMWTQLNRIGKENCPFIFTSMEPFSSQLIYSNPKNYKYKWHWNKVNRSGGFLNAKREPLRIVEEILVFYRKPPTYNPLIKRGKPYKTVSGKDGSSNYKKGIGNNKE